MIRYNRTGAGLVLEPPPVEVPHTPRRARKRLSDRASPGQAEPHVYFTVRMPKRLVDAVDAQGRGRTRFVRELLELAFEGD